MESYRNNYNNPLSFSCTNCGHSQSKYLPPGTNMTGCSRCGTLITISALPRNRTNQMANNQTTTNRRNPPMRQSNRNNEVNYLNDDYDEDDSYYTPYDRFDYSSPQPRALQNSCTHTNGNRNSNRNGNGNDHGHGNNQHQGEQGMFSLHFPNENYNRHSTNARRFNQDDLTEEELFDLEFESELNQLMRIGQMRLSRQALRDINLLTNVPSTKPKPKVRKITMNLKLYTKNSKGKLEAPTCCICLNLMKSNDEITQLKCKHMFHYLCLTKWIETKEECPFCRGKIV